MNYKLFTTPTCKFCPDVKAFLATIDVKGEHFDAATPEGREEAVKYGISTVPTVLFFDNNELKATARSINEIKQVLT